MSEPRVALVHDFFVTDGGAEGCALEFARLLPTATVHTSFFDARRFGDRIDPARVRTWPLQAVLGPTKRFRQLLPLYPAWFSLLDLRAADVVVSNSVAFAKAVRTRADAVHVTYAHTTLRYAWDQDQYLAASSYRWPTRLGAALLREPLRRWDRRTAAGPTYIVANSGTVRERIARRWGRDSEVIYPPVDVAGIPLSQRDEGYLFVAARLLGYRRLDLAVQAARLLGRRLLVAGEGPERARLEALAGPQATFLGHVSRAELLELFAGCSAYLVPGVEDFGIAPVEAMAAGKPVVAFRAGGALETVVDGVTGTFFDEDRPAALADAVRRLDRLAISPAAVRDRAEQFDRSVFLDRWRDLLARLGVPASIYSPR